jgi:hypothetical protein
MSCCFLGRVSVLVSPRGGGGQDDVVERGKLLTGGLRWCAVDGAVKRQLHRHRLRRSSLADNEPVRSFYYIECP